MRQIAKWLDAIGLAKYQWVFADNEIDRSLLPKLTEADLKELGLSLGARKKFLEAVANLGTPTVGTSADKPREAERSQVTVMYLVGSTALSARMDPKLCLREGVTAKEANGAGELISTAAMARGAMQSAFACSGGRFWRRFSL